MDLILLGIGLVLIVEGLVFALAPSRLDDLVTLMASLTKDHRRLIGLSSLTLGVVFLWLALPLTP